VGRCTNFCYSRAATAGVCCAVWSADSKYVIVPRGHGQIRDLWVFPVERGLFRKTLQPVQLTNGPLLYSGAAVSADGNQLFAVGVRERGRKLLPRIRSAWSKPPTQKRLRERRSDARDAFSGALHVFSSFLALGVWAIWLPQKRSLFSVIWFLPFGLAIVALMAVVILWSVPQWQVRHASSPTQKRI